MALPSFCWLNLSLTPRFQIFRLFQISQPHKNTSVSSFTVAITLREARSSGLIVCSALRSAKTAFFFPTNQKQQPNQFHLVGRRFPALLRPHVLLWVLIGWMDCPRLLCLRHELHSEKSRKKKGLLEFSEESVNIKCGIETMQFPCALFAWLRNLKIFFDLN